MCGIYGSTIKYNATQVIEKLKRTSFRGPDFQGYEEYSQQSNHVILGHNRLSIIDLEPRSNQPFNYFHKVAIVFNGEIYNFKSLKKQLEHEGFMFKTKSDTEVVCAAYVKYGPQCAEHLNGMFAFVIYDFEKQRLFGARDRLGQKPFYYYHNGKEFEFSSQISSIHLGNKKLTISSSAISDYLEWSAIPDNQSIFNEIKKLNAGHYFLYDLDSGKFEDFKYWDINLNVTEQFSGSYSDALVELEAVLIDATTTRMFADVPIGVFLSGGVDSSLVSALAAKHSNNQIKTFSVKFDEKGFDESIYSQKVAEHIGSEHTIINCNYSEGLDLIANFSYYFDEPFADASAVPSLLLSKHTRKHVTVALSGDAGDEMFLGYHRYHWINYLRKIYSLPKGLRMLLCNSLAKTPHYKAKVVSKVIKSETVEHAYLSILKGYDASWLTSPSNNGQQKEFKYLSSTTKNIYERASDFDMKTYLNWDINTKVDRATMAYSLEVRSPLMDHRVVEFANSLPTAFKMKGSGQKLILKDLLYNYVPKSFFDRPKAGFTMPFKNWFRNELKDFVLSELSEDNLKSIPGINPQITKQYINQHMDGSWNRYELIWKVLVLKQWLDNNGKGYSIV